MLLTSLEAQFGDPAYGSLLSRCYLDACRGPVQLLKVLHLSGDVGLHVEIRSGLLFVHQFEDQALQNNALCVNLEDLEVLDCLGQSLDSHQRLHLALLSKRGIVHLNWHRSGTNAVSFFDEFLSAALGQFGTGDHISTGAFRWSALVSTSPSLFFMQPFREKDVSLRVTSGAMMSIEQVALGFYDGTVAVIDRNSHTVLSTNPAPTSNFLVKLLSLETASPNPILSLATRDGMIACVNSLGVLHVWNREATRIVEHPLVTERETIHACSVKLVNHGSHLAVGVNFTEQGLRSVVVTAESTFSLHHNHAAALLAEHISAELELDSFTASLLDMASSEQGLSAIWAVTLHYLASGLPRTARVLHVVTQGDAIVHSGQRVDVCEARLPRGLSPRQVWQVLTRDRYPVSAIISAWQAVSGHRVVLPHRVALAQRILTDLDQLVDQGSAGERKTDVRRQRWTMYTDQLCVQLEEAAFDVYQSVFVCPGDISPGGGEVVCAFPGALLGVVLPLASTPHRDTQSVYTLLRQPGREAICAQFRDDCLSVLVHTPAKDWLRLLTAQTRGVCRRLFPLGDVERRPRHRPPGDDISACVHQALHHCRTSVSWSSPRWRWTRVCHHIDSCVEALQGAAILLARHLATVSRLSLEDRVVARLHSVLREWTVWLCLQSFTTPWDAAPSTSSVPVLADYLHTVLRGETARRGPLPALRPRLDDGLSLHLVAAGGRRCPAAADRWAKAAAVWLLPALAAAGQPPQVRRRVLGRCPSAVGTATTPAACVEGLVTAAMHVVRGGEAVGTRDVAWVQSLAVAFPPRASRAMRGLEEGEGEGKREEEGKEDDGHGDEDVARVHGQVSGLLRALGAALYGEASSTPSSSSSSSSLGVLPRRRAGGPRPWAVSWARVHAQLRDVCTAAVQRPRQASLDRGLLVLASLLSPSSPPSSSAAAVAACRASPLALSVGHLVALHALDGRLPHAPLALLSVLACLDRQSPVLQQQLARDLVDDVLVKVVQRGGFHDVVFPSVGVRRLCEEHAIDMAHDVRRAALLAGDPTASLDLVCALHLYRQHWTTAAEIALHQLTTSSGEPRVRSGRAAVFRMILSVAPAADQAVLRHHFEEWFRSQASPLPAGDVADLAFLLLHTASFVPRRGETGGSGAALAAPALDGRLEAAQISQTLLGLGIWNLWLPLVACSREAAACRGQDGVLPWLGRCLAARPDPRTAWLCAMQAPLVCTAPPSSCPWHVSEMCHVLWQHSRRGGDVAFHVLDCLLGSYPHSMYCQELVRQMAGGALDHSVQATKRLLHVLLRWKAEAVAGQVAARCLDRPNGLDFLCTSLDMLAVADPAVRTAVSRVLERALLQ